MTRRSIPLEERFWPKVAKSDGCWLWQGATTTHGYGCISESKRTLVASRVAYQLAVGDIPHGLQVLHHCDVRRCVNPAHLFLGTPSDNMLDMWGKGRGKIGPKDAHPAGEAHPMAKVSAAQVAAIRERYAAAIPAGHTKPRYGDGICNKLAAEYGLSRSAIWRIANRTYWNRKETT